MIRVARVRCALVALLPLTLSACLSGPSPVDHHYRLEVAAPATSAAKPALSGVLEVDRPRSDALTNQLPLLYRNDGGVEIKRHTYNLWMSPPTTMIQNELIDFLRASGVARQVVPPQARVKTDYHVTSRLARLERVLGSQPRVVVELELSVTRDGGRLMLLEQYREERAAAGSDVSQAVGAYDQALAAIFGRFVEDLKGLGN